MHKDAPAFDFYPERFWFAVEGWTDSEVTRYFRLLGQQWMRDGLPVDRKEFEALARGKVSERVFDKFPVADDGKRRNRFLEKLRGEQRKRIAKRRLGAEITNAKRNAERPAARDIERPASATPPPTTHHPPQETAIQTPRIGLPDSEAQAISMAEAAGVPADYAVTIFNEHEGATWEDGQGRPINNFARYIKARYTNRTEKHAREEKRYGARQSTNGFPAQPKTETVWQLQQALQAVKESIVEVESRQTGVWGNLSKKSQEELKKLYDRKREIRSKLTGLEATT